MSVLFDQIRQLHSDQLFTNLVQLLNLLLPQLESTSQLFSPSNEYKVLLFYGDALYKTKDYRRAERVYHRALSLKKNTPKTKRKSQNNGSNDLSSEIDVKYQIHLCYLKLQQYSNASIVLESIPPKHRNARINMALGEIYKLDKNPSAVNCFKEVLKESPFALTAIINLIKLEVKVNDILSIVNTAIASIPSMSWLSTWIRAHSYLNSVQVPNAISLLRQLHESSQFKDNIEIMLSLGEAYYYTGEYKKAIPLFRKAFSSDPMLIRGLDFYSSSLAKENLIKELENLSNQLIQRCDTFESVAEPWIALSYYCFLSNRKDSKALFFAQKACSISNNSIESLLLKGMILSENKTQEAKTCFQEAHSIAPHRFEPFKCLADCYLSEKQKNMAANMANMAIKTLGHSPRTLTLFASVFLSDPINNEKTKAKQALERVVKQDSGYLSAVFLLSNIYSEEKNFEKSIEILNKAIECTESNVKLHKLLIECYTEKNDPEKASHHRSIVTNLELCYRNSSECSQRLEQSVHDNLSSTHDNEGDDIPPSDEDLDESETDVVWSDDNL